MKNSKPDTPCQNSWAHQEAARVKPTERDPETDRLMRAGIVHPSIQNAVYLCDAPKDNRK